MHFVKILKEFPSKSWNERSLRRLLKQPETQVRLTGVQGAWDRELYAYCRECDHGDLMSRQPRAGSGVDPLRFLAGCYTRRL